MDSSLAVATERTRVQIPKSKLEVSSQGATCNPSTQEADNRFQGNWRAPASERLCLSKESGKQTEHSTQNQLQAYTHACTLVHTYTDTLETSIHTLIHWFPQSQVQWHASIIPALGSLQHGDLESDINLGSTGRETLPQK